MMTCKAFNKNGDRCGAVFGLSWDGYCRWHSTEKLCRGKGKGGVQCTALRKPDYEYCCAAHDPALYFLSPSLFGRENLRAEKIGVVAEYCGGRDIYHNEKLDADKLHEYQIDHILEKQCFAFVTVQAGITRKSDQEWVTAFLRDEIANRTKNLGITRRETNALKAKACFRFLDDYVTGHRERGDGLTLDTYLKKSQLDGAGGRLERATTVQIRRAMGKRVKFSQRKLAAEADTPEFGQISIELQKMYVDMDLKVRSMA